MCFELDSVPPIPPISGASVSHDDLVLESRDGNRFAAFLATPDEPNGIGVVILPDVRGLYRFYEELALRFAERGYTAIAIDYFGRTAGVAKRDDDFPYMEHRSRTTPEGIEADIAAAVERLRAEGCRSVFTIGFCFGARQSWLAAAEGHGLRSDRVLRDARRARRRPRADTTCGGDRRADPRPAGRRRPAHHPGTQRGVRGGVDRRRSGVRAR